MRLNLDNFVAKKNMTNLKKKPLIANTVEPQKFSSTKNEFIIVVNIHICIYKVNCCWKHTALIVTQFLAYQV